MKTFLLLVLGVLLALIVVNRRRIFVRDPLATVYKSDLHQGGKTNARQSGKSSLRQSGKSSLRQSGTPNQSQDVVTESMQSAMAEQVQSGGVIVPQQSGNSGKSQNAAAELLQISKATGQLQSGVSGVLRASKVEQVQSEVSGLLQKVDPDLLQGSDKDGKQSGVQVFVNASGDVLLWQDAEPGAYRILVQGWNKAPGTPVRLTCLRWMVCLTDADHPTTLPIDWIGNSGRGKGKYDPHVSMTGREVSFVNGDGATVRVELR
ncbi:MAG: hypothetical protein ABR889_11015 [Acidobacteriaceae bacterium]|jgi:hypothetical protein